VTDYARIIMKIYIIILLVAVSFAAGHLSCSDSETRKNSLLQQATVIINIGMPEEHASLSRSIINRIFHFFVRDAIAQTAPAAISSIVVRVTGPDMSPIERIFPPTGGISFSVPAGNVRQFEVIAAVAPEDPGAAASFSGMAVANLPAGASVNVPVVMRLHETKIIVPDYYNNRLLIMDTVSGTYTSKQGTSFIGDYNITPYDIDFDSKGRMYISDHYNNDIVRVNSFSLTDPNPPVWFNVTNVPNAIAVDRVNDIVYYTDTANLYRRTLDGAALPPMPIDTITNIYGFDVGPDGNLYIAGVTSTSGAGVYKYNVSTGMVTGQYSNPTVINNPYDVQVKYPFIYVLTPWATSSDYNVLQLQIGLNNSITLVNNGPNPVIGTLNNVGHFTSIISNGILMMGKYPERLVFMNDVNGSGWQENSGSAGDPFNFFDYGGGG
jgi:hypothetical protein